MKKLITYKTRITGLIPVLAALLLAGGLLISDTQEDTEVLSYDKPEGYTRFYRKITTGIGQSNNGYKVGYQFAEYKKTRALTKSYKKASGIYNWVLRGPGNVGGRTREVIIDPDDPTHNTWYAAAASGGVWKTSDGGQTWRNLTEELFNLATNTIAMAPSDHDILYIGTGEGYGGFGMVSGNGLFRSTNRGVTWEHIASTNQEENFRWVNKIVIDQDDENILLVATNKGIFKTYDGGLNWDSVYFKGYAVQDIVVNLSNPNTLYAGVNSLGIIKSYDNGSTWFDAHSGIGTGYRFALTISPVDTNYLYTSVEAPATKTDVYSSRDGAKSWNKLKDSDLTFIDFLGEQGWFNNVIKADPFDKNKVFIGGVNLGSIRFNTGTSISEPQVIRVDTFGTGSYMIFVNFQGEFLRGGLTTGLAEDADVDEADYVSVEIRFGPGISQYAHRFTVPEGEGAGVPPDAYAYEDYTIVPFQAWDIDNNRQLMISYRDQDDNGNFNLIERVWDDEAGGREYIFIHAVEYNNTQPAADIAQDGGHYYKMLYFTWPTLAEDKKWRPDNLPASLIRISYGTFQLQEASTTVLADKNRNKDLHVDHHDIEIVITDELNKEYMLVEANDGGLGVSYDRGLTWKQIKNGYHTTQFYGVAKKPYEHEYIGGMQDNGTWQSPGGVPAGPDSEYNDRIAGDGFEVLWHPEYPHRILGSSYYNIIRVTTDGGKTWDDATNGIKGVGPFITRLSHSPENPDLVFAVGNRGVYYHTNFGIGRYPWKYVQIDTGWAVLNQVTSSHNVEVSLADPSVVWAGAGMFQDPDLYLFVSEDYGKTFTKANLFTRREMGYITGIATHPHDTATAYALFSMDHKPKILRTEDLGESWEDITGFGADSVSKNGFPDVVVYSLLVFPENPRMIWAGTEIGIYESTDNGESWHFADMGFPTVSVWQMFLQDNTIVIATHGRGIWTCTDYPYTLRPEKEVPEFDFRLYPNPSGGITILELTSEDSETQVNINVYNQSGTQLLSFSEEKTNNRFLKQIDLSNLPQGIYLISVDQGNSKVTRRIVKQ